MLRLQRVTFTALHSYLGLTSEIMKIEKKSSKIHNRHHHHHHHRNSKKNSKDVEVENSNSDLSSNGHSNEHIVSLIVFQPYYLFILPYVLPGDISKLI